MKNLILIMILAVIPFYGTAQSTTIITKEGSEILEKSNDGEWNLNVIDIKFDYFLKNIARPIDKYSEPNLKNRNLKLVTEWNNYYKFGQYTKFIDRAINYNPQENYGIKFEYKLYQIFAYVNWRYHLRMEGLDDSDISK